MASSSKAQGAHRRGFPVAIKILALCLIAFVALLFMLPAPPDSSPGGITRVSKRVPVLRESVDPLTNQPDAVAKLPDGVPHPSVEPVIPGAASQEPAPVIAAAPETPPPIPLRKPETGPPPAPSQWNTDSQSAPEPPPRDVARLPDQSVPSPAPATQAGLPSKSDIEGWLKSQAWEFLGGVDDQGNILYRFEVWLEAPRETLKGISKVAYVYDAPSATPPTREIDRADGGFRARFGGLACAKQVTVTLTMTDGRSRSAKVDGCQALN